jgi:peptidylamidoglycolate lyase
MNIKTLLVASAACLGFSAPAFAQTPAATPPGYSVVHGWPHMPSGYALGQVTGVGIDSHNRVFVFHRAGRVWTEPFPTTKIQGPTIVAFDGETGDVVQAWGEDLFIMPHGLEIDSAENIWVTDVALQQVFKFSPKGELLMTLGEAGVAGDDDSHFNRPTDVAVAPDGTFYVSDGYENSRVLKFSADGRLLLKWGERGTGPGQFDLPHAIDLDARGRVYVADRENDRVQVFDADGRFLTQWTSEAMGRPYGVAIAPGGLGFALVVDGGEQPERGPDRSGAAIIDPAGLVVQRFGAYGPYDGQFELAHDGAVGADGAVYVVDGVGERVQKFTPR